MPLRPEDLSKLQGLKVHLQAEEAAARAQKEAPKIVSQTPEASSAPADSQPPLNTTKKRQSRFVDANQLFSGEVRPGDEAWDTVRTPQSESQRMAERHHGRYFRGVIDRGFNKS